MDPELSSDLAALLVAMPSACMASLHRNSLTDERTTARPSPALRHREAVRNYITLSEPWTSGTSYSNIYIYIKASPKIKHIHNLNKYMWSYIQNLSTTLNMAFCRSLWAVVPIFHLFCKTMHFKSLLLLYDYYYYCELCVVLCLVKQDPPVGILAKQVSSPIS